MTGITALLLFIGWTLVLALSYAGFRVPPILLGKKSANHWERGQPVDDPAILVRAKGAHLNCLENLPLFAALVLIGVVTNRSAIVDSVAGVMIAARFGQSIVHLIGTSLPLILVRATLFVVQVVIMLYLTVALLT